MVSVRFCAAATAITATACTAMAIPMAATAALRHCDDGSDMLTDTDIAAAVLITTNTPYSRKVVVENLMAEGTATATATATTTTKSITSTTTGQQEQCTLKLREFSKYDSTHPQLGFEAWLYDGSGQLLVSSGGGSSSRFFGSSSGSRGRGRGRGSTNGQRFYVADGRSYAIQNPLLPHWLALTVGSSYDDPVRFRYGSHAFSSDDDAADQAACSVTPQRGYKDMRCSFPC